DCQQSAQFLTHRGGRSGERGRKPRGRGNSLAGGPSAEDVADSSGERTLRVLAARARLREQAAAGLLESLFERARCHAQRGHAGKIYVRSTPGKGTSFHVEFPAARKAAHV